MDTVGYSTARQSWCSCWNYRGSHRVNRRRNCWSRYLWIPMQQGVALHCISLTLRTLRIVGYSLRSIAVIREVRRNKPHDLSASCFLLVRVGLGFCNIVGRKNKPRSNTERQVVVPSGVWMQCQTWNHLLVSPQSELDAWCKFSSAWALNRRSKGCWDVQYNWTNTIDFERFLLRERVKVSWLFLEGKLMAPWLSDFWCHWSWLV